MCDPITIGLLVAGAAASVAGGQITQNESQENAAAIARARNDELNKTLARNKQYADQSRDIFNKRVSDIDANANQDIEATQTQHKANIQENIPAVAPTGDVAMPASAPQVVKSSLGKKLSDVFGESTDRANRLGALTGYGGFFQDQGIKDQAAGRDVGVNADSIAGNMRLLPSLQDYRQLEATKPSSGLGQILSALGSVAASAAGAGVGAKANPEGFLKPNFANLNKSTGMFGGGV